MKKILYFLLILITIFGLCSCRNKTKTEISTEQIKEVVPTEPEDDVVTEEKPTEEVVPTEPEDDVITEEKPTEEVVPTEPEDDVVTEEKPTEEVVPTEPVPDNPVSPDTPTVPDTPVFPDEIEELDVPLLQMDEYGLVVWDAIEDATYYNYIINDGQIITTTSLMVELSDRSTISVQACNEDLKSNWSKPLTIYETIKYETISGNVNVKFHNTNYNNVTILSGNKVVKPNDPVKENHTFEGWYADPYYQQPFDFNELLYSNTIIYAKFIPNDLLNDTYYWVKGSPLMNSSVMSSGSSSDWHYIPLKLNTKQTEFKEYYVTVTVTGASEANPCKYIIVDGLSDDSGRTYWKNNGDDFTINSNGTYNIYFSVEHEYSKGVYALAYNLNRNSLESNKYDKTLDTPVITINKDLSNASWNKIENATKYEVVIDNKEIITTISLSIELDEGSFITVRAINDTGFSNWSIPNANMKSIFIDDETDECSVHFVGYESYNVKINESINPNLIPTKEGYTFAGWSLEFNGQTGIEFPYTITKNTVFYPIWISNEDYTTKIYYQLVNSNGNVIKGLTWNLDNYSFDEYETGKVNLTKNISYYIVSVEDSNIKYGPYKVNENGEYKIYFSEENLWEGNSNVYIQQTIKTFYITNNKYWTDSIYVYSFNKSTGEYDKSWPGTKATYVETNDYGEQIYKINVDISKYDHIIISHGTLTNGNYSLSSQTIDLKLSDYTSNAFYMVSKNSEGKYTVGTWNKE